VPRDPARGGTIDFQGKGLAHLGSMLVLGQLLGSAATAGVTSLSFLQAQSPRSGQSTARACYYSSCLSTGSCRQKGLAKRLDTRLWLALALLALTHLA